MKWMILSYFFKQKTAYEMRISAWSSDVCSSDLGARPESRSSHAILYTLARNRPRLGIDRKHRIDAFRRGRSIARQRISDDCGNFKKSDRTAERRVGTECVRTGRSWWSPGH